MTFRKRKTPSPSFRLPPPFDPRAGQHASMDKPGLHTRLSVFQVVGDDGTAENQDTHDNYILCRGWDLDTDPDCKYLFDPTANAQGKGIAVAKPYGVRGTYPYVLGQMVVVAKVRTRLGDNPGVAHTTAGQPADLDEVIDLLTDVYGNPISWLDIGGGGDTLRLVELKTSLTPGGIADAWFLEWDSVQQTYVNPDHNAAPDLSAANGNSVWDPQNRFRSLGYEDTPEDISGAVMFVNSVGAVVSGQQKTKICLCQLTAAQTGSDTSFIVDTITPLDSGQIPSATTATVYNVPKCAGANGAPAMIEFNETSGHWEVQWIVNVSQSVVTNEQIDGTNKLIQIKTRTMWGNWVGSESGWTTIHTGGACP